MTNWTNQSDISSTWTVSSSVPLYGVPYNSDALYNSDLTYNEEDTPFLPIWINQSNITTTWT